MDRVYPEGTIVVCIRYSDIGREPKAGERVICLRRDAGGEYEATIKEYQVDEQGRHILWPRSADPEFQQPIVLTGPTLPVAAGQEVLPSTVSAGRIFDDGGEPDLVIAALVTGSWRRE